jgi:DNA-directed RNA polymerase specialized sigma24 family protein
MAVMERTPGLGSLMLDEAQTRAVDEASFRVLYDATSPPLRAYLLHVCRRPDVAADLLQETYCRWLMRRHPVMDEAQTRSYLFRIATNLLHDRVRSRIDTIVPEIPERGSESNRSAAAASRLTPGLSRPIAWSPSMARTVSLELRSKARGNHTPAP